MFFSFLFMLPTWYNYTCNWTCFFVLESTWHASNPKLYQNTDIFLHLFPWILRLKGKTKYQSQCYYYSKS